MRLRPAAAQRRVSLDFPGSAEGAQQVSRSLCLQATEHELASSLVCGWAFEITYGRRLITFGEAARPEDAYIPSESVLSISLHIDTCRSMRSYTLGGRTLKRKGCKVH